jgi:HAE1 family hydrophobic/amphiphilic exporter-1
MQAAQDVRLGGRPTGQFEFTLQDANLFELNEWAPQYFQRCRRCGVRDVATDQQTNGTTVELKIAIPPRWHPAPAVDDTLYDAFGQRR